MVHRHHHTPRLHRALVGLIFLGLLFQVQSVFACQMVDEHRGLAAACCCEGQVGQVVQDPMSHADCCEFDSMVTANSDDESMSLVPRLSQPDPSPALLAFVLVSLRPLPASSDSVSALKASRFPLGDPGSHTWLQTRRLRI